MSKYHFCGTGKFEVSVHSASVFFLLFENLKKKFRRPSGGIYTLKIANIIDYARAARKKNENQTTKLKFP